nr:5'-nucleotidase [Arthrobacter stackebrandtii]
MENRLVIGVSSSALFDLKESDEYFLEHGEEKYRTYQDEHIDDTLQPGVAFPFIQRLLSLNDLRDSADPLVEVLVLSKNDPSTGLRVMRSVAAHKLQISRAVFTQGKSPYEYVEAFDMSLFLSGNRQDVDAAIERGFPAGHVLPSTAIYTGGDSLRVAFDFDGVLGDDEAERVYQENPGDISKYYAYETLNRERPLAPGPLQRLLQDLNMIQKIETARKESDPAYQPRLRISLITARSAPAHERAVRSLSGWGVTVNDAFFLGGIEKSKVLKVMRPHIFFDDQTTHLTPSAGFAAGVHVPYGVTNETTDLSEESSTLAVDLVSPETSATSAHELHPVDVEHHS